MADPAETPPADTASGQAPPADQAPASPTPLFICPYCGGPTPDQPRCAQCSGLLDPLSRQATQNAMGPWFIRDEAQPHRPGCSYETILALITRGKVTRDSVLRGPTTAQFWYPAKRIPGIANKLGLCHACQTRIDGESGCPACHTLFEVEGDRQTLGLLPIRMIPTPGAPEGSVSTATEPAALEPRPSAPPSRVMGSIAVPSVAENRLRAELTAAKRRSTLLLAALVVVAIIGLVAVVVFATETSSSSRDRVVQPSGPSASGSGSEPLTPAPRSTPIVQPEVATAPATESTQPQASPRGAPAPAPAHAAPPNQSNSELDVLRRSKIP